MRFKYVLSCFLILLLANHTVSGQSRGWPSRIPLARVSNQTVNSPQPENIVVDTLNSIQDIISTMFGPAITVSNLTVSGASVALGKFHDLNATIGMDSGIVLTSGSIYNVPGPNVSGSVSTMYGYPGDSTLNSITTGPTFDAVVIEFDFIPYTDTLIACKMVFGSDEYLEWVGSSFNDVFGFFVSGPGFNGLENLAVIDTNGTIISINSINSLTNSQFFINNTGGLDLEYDGYTTVIQFMRPIINGASYHFKIAIADVADPAYDSGIFLKAKSFLSYACQPVAGFNVQVAGNMVSFANTTNYAKKYIWDFGDGTIDSTSLNPSHTYTVSGQYHVKLTAINYYETGIYETDIAVGGAGIIPVQPKPSLNIAQLSPAVFKLKIENCTQAAATLYHPDGRVCQQMNMNNGSDHLLDLGSGSRGMYILRVTAGNEVFTHKLVVP